jgi:phosphomannomutase
MKTIAIVVNVIYYLSLIYMWYKIYSIGKHIIKKNKEHAHQQASVPAKEDESLSTETTNKEVISTTPQYDSEYMRKLKDFIYEKEKHIIFVLCFHCSCGCTSKTGIN